MLMASGGRSGPQRTRAHPFRSLIKKETSLIMLSEFRFDELLWSWLQFFIDYGRLEPRLFPDSIQTDRKKIVNNDGEMPNFDGLQAATLLAK
jgi:hypothetical protein